MKAYKPLVSVLMTVYNREKYLAQAIESVLASTYSNWELIIVDDRSKDNSVEIAKTYATRDPRIQVHVNENNLGDYPNRNKAASYAKGKYLKYLDADDLIYPYGLEQLVFYMEQFPEAGYGLCSLNQDEQRVFPFELSPRDAYYRHYFQAPLFHKAPLSSIIKREVFEKVGGFSGKRMLGDFEMWHVLSRQFNVVLMSHGIVWYRVHEEQEMSDHRADPMEPFKYLLLTRSLLSHKRCPLEKDHVQLALKMNKNKIARSVLSAFKHSGVNKGKELFCVSELNLLSLFKYGLS